MWPEHLPPNSLGNHRAIQLVEPLHGLSVLIQCDPANITGGSGMPTEDNGLCVPLDLALHPVV